MMETIKGLSEAKGFLMALASMVADRELCGEQRDSFVMEEAYYLASQISNGVDFIIGDRHEIESLRKSIEQMIADDTEVATEPQKEVTGDDA